MVHPCVVALRPPLLMQTPGRLSADRDGPARHASGRSAFAPTPGARGMPGSQPREGPARPAEPAFAGPEPLARPSASGLSEKPVRVAEPLSGPAPVRCLPYTDRTARARSAGDGCRQAGTASLSPQCLFNEGKETATWRP